MPTYKEFAALARARFQKSQERKKKAIGEFRYTEHSRYKMRQYGLSEQKVRGVIRSPRRTEKGIVPQTIAVMQPVSPKKTGDKETWRQEIWVMYQEKKKTGPLERGQKKIISAWRYPGVSPERDPIPAEILQEIESWSDSETGV